MDKRPDNWEWTHEHQAALVKRDGWMCEEHPGTKWPHGDCAGPGMPWMVEGREAISKLLSEQREAAKADEREACVDIARSSFDQSDCIAAIRARGTEPH